MRMKDSAGEKERFIGCSLVEVLKVVDGVIGFERVVILALLLVQNPPVRHTGKEVDS